MGVEAARTTSKTEGPQVKQFSIFLKNKVGALLDVVKLLNEHNIHVLALNVQDSADSAIVRIVVSDPERVQDLFGSGAGGQNGSTLLDAATVINDVAINQLIGGSDQDWFWLEAATDKLSHEAAGEVVSVK